MFVTWNTAQDSDDSLADCFPSLRKDFLIRYAEIAAFMKRKTHFATVWMSPLLSESRNLIQFHTESIQKSLVFSRRLLPSLLHTNIRSFSEPNFHEHEPFRLVSRERARQRWLHQWKRHDRFPCPSFPLLYLIFNGDDYVKKRKGLILWSKE